MAVPGKWTCGAAGLFMAALGCLPVMIAPLAHATPSAARRTGKECSACHISTGSKKLNDVGAYYKKKNTLRGAPIESQRQKERQKSPSVYYQSKYPY